MAQAVNAGRAWPAWVERPLATLKRQFGLVRPATEDGMGALPNGDGVVFRVWAPHAESVFVAGTFNNWSTWRTPLAPEGDGRWSATVRNAGPGDQYKFVIRRNGAALLRSDPYGRYITQPHRNSVVRPDGEPSAGEAPFPVPPLNELVIYELHAGTFSQGGAHGVGDFQGVVDKLPYLRALGVNAIELMPAAEFPGAYSWGYNPSHPFVVSQAYGGRDALVALIRAAHRAGIAVLVDVVYNHFGPQDLDLWRFDGWHENDLGGIYFYNDWRAATPWGHTRPDYGRPEVRQFLLDNAAMWLEEVGADGLRWDATSYIRTAGGFDGDGSAGIADGWSLMRHMNDELNARFPGRIFIAEDMQHNASITLPTEHGGAGFQAQWDAAFVHAIRHAVISPSDETRSMAAVNSARGFPLQQQRLRPRGLHRIARRSRQQQSARPRRDRPSKADSYFAKKRSTLGGHRLHRPASP